MLLFPRVNKHKTKNKVQKNFFLKKSRDSFVNRKKRSYLTGF